MNSIWITILRRRMWQKDPGQELEYWQDTFAKTTDCTWLDDSPIDHTKFVAQCLSLNTLTTPDVFIMQCHDLISVLICARDKVNHSISPGREAKDLSNLDLVWMEPNSFLPSDPHYQPLDNRGAFSDNWSMITHPPGQCAHFISWYVYKDHQRLVSIWMGSEGSIMK